MSKKLQEANEPLISVVMNAYNSSQYLAPALDSLFQQSYQNWELIFWDNGSTDNTQQIYQQYADKRCRYILHKQKVSLAQARNMAVSEAKGSWVAFLDCDDIWLKDKLKLQLHAAKQNINNALIYCRTNSFTERGVQGETIPFYVDKLLPTGKILTDLMRHGNIISMSSAMVKTDIYEQMGGIKTVYQFAEDYYLFCSIAEQYDVACEQSVQCLYRVHNNSATYARKKLGLIESIAVLKRWRKALKDKEFVKRRKIYHTLIAVDTLLHHKQWKRGMLHIWRYADKLYLFCHGIVYCWRRFIKRRRLVS